MIEYRFRSTKNNLDVLNRYTPANYKFVIDRFTGDSWIKIPNSYHTQSFMDRVKMYCELQECEDTIKITDSSNQRVKYENTIKPLF